VSANARRTEIIRILRAEQQTTTARLAAIFNVSAKTIQRDILTLTVDEEYPIDTIKGNKGGIMLKNHKHPHKHILSQEQIEVLTRKVQDSNAYDAEILNGILKAFA
jgi:predicted DNA-binding transcriptional regulator YafY